MSDRVSPARPVTHRRNRGRRPRVDRYLLDEVAGVLVAPLLCIIVLWSTTVCAAWAYEGTTAQLAAALGGSVLITALVGAVRVRAVAASLQQQHDVELQQITDAVNAAERTVIFMADQICQGVKPPLPPGAQQAGDGMLAQVLAVIDNLQVQGAHAMQRVQDESQAAVLVEMHQTLTRRQHTLIDEMLEQLTSLQRATEDPELLDRSFKIDHLATRLRRMVESVSVVLGGKSLRETRSPVQVATVLRGAKAEVVKYERVQTAAGAVGSAFALPAHVHPDVAHLLAELIDNGVENSDPATKVTVRAQRVALGLLIEVEDRSTLLMDYSKREMLNRLLANPAQADVAGQVRAGSLGLITTATIAAKYGLKVWLTMNATGGTTANVVVPSKYLVPTAPVVSTVSVQPRRQTPAREPALAGAAPSPVHPAPAEGRPAQQPDGGDEGPLPKRTPQARPMHSQPTSEPARPAQAANPQAAADWRSGLAAGRQAEPAPRTAPRPQP
ncbi:histidine kinase [Streptomyces umbrinus]|uniref:ATP-binding protein n=1 Tax=Streptomyces umbrinus TaxID=67370 RepID=UPI001672C85F|nr:ATP-binding protein [Streptomyces umbrinus]GHB81817.1 histidine kinase [Streptomyces umbrinus]